MGLQNKTKMATRPLFSDGLSSLSHVIFGFLAKPKPIIIPLFLGYELKDVNNDPNTLVDCIEFGFGYFIASFQQ
jgi:hypothetical protein